MSQQPPGPHGERPWTPPSTGPRPPIPPLPPPPGHPPPPYTGPPFPYGAPLPYGTPPPDPGPAPTQVRLASTLVFVLVGLATVNLVLLAFDNSYLETTIQRSLAAQPRPQTAPFDPSFYLAFIRASLLGSAVIGIGLYVWIGIKVRQGRTWARIVITVLLGLAVTAFLVSLVQLTAGTRQPVYSYGFNLVATVLAAAILVLVWRQPAAGWFPARTAWDREQRRLRATG